MKIQTRLKDIYDQEAYVSFSIDGLQGAILLKELVNDPRINEWFDAVLTNGGLVQGVKGEQIEDGSFNLTITTLNTSGEKSEEIFTIPLATAEKAGLLRKEDYNFLKDAQSKGDVIFSANTTPIDDDADLEGALFGWSLTASENNEVINERLEKRASFYIDASLSILGFLPNLKYIRLESIPENINGVFSALLPPISELGYSEATNVKVKYNTKLKRWLALWYNGEHIMPLATKEKAGLMSSDDKNRLDAMEDKIVARVLTIEENIRQDFGDADTGLGNRITEETEARKKADEAFDVRLANEESGRVSQDDVLEYLIKDETKAREQADTTLQDNINALKKVASAENDGLMSKEDKAKLDNLKETFVLKITKEPNGELSVTTQQELDFRNAVINNQPIEFSIDEFKVKAISTMCHQLPDVMGGGFDYRLNAYGKYLVGQELHTIIVTDNITQHAPDIKIEDKVDVTPYAEDLLSYGVEIPKPSEKTSKVRRIGNMEMHRTLPIQSKMRGCLLDDDGKVVEYLPEDDWTTATRDGSKGQVMVEIPEHWERFYINEQGLQCARISEINLPGYFFVPKMYVSAYEATLQRSTNKLCSVVNQDADYRGGNNTAEFDGQYNSLLGLPVTNLGRPKFREYARNRNGGKTTEWNCYLYEAHRILFWLYIIEYADRNIQLPYNAQKTAEGYMQGGLGTTPTLNYTDWTNYNKNNPIYPCGYTDEFGNRSGSKQFIMDDNADFQQERSVPRYRGIENLYGHILEWCDGLNLVVSPTAENGGDDTSKVYACNDPALFSDESNENYEYLGNETRVNGYITDIFFGKRGYTINNGSIGGTTQTNYCDHAYVKTDNKVEELRGFLLGGSVFNGSATGLAFSYSYNVPSRAFATIGSRLCFSPAEAKHDTNPI